eukprot:TRINITY_DN15469_c1_g1_i1.p1 TRINITY_DN15469_c1_g1~~TRINITY_DN15469_c1_g1_i1.p1  ORF type:complete len:1590 (+),score=456.28 TRINITY_DN15469_c1_g1_i1:59-4771(+)
MKGIGKLFRAVKADKGQQKPDAGRGAAADPFVSHVLRHGGGGVRLAAWDADAQLLALARSDAITVFGAEWVHRRVRLPPHYPAGEVRELAFLAGQATLCCLAPDALAMCDLRTGDVSLCTAGGSGVWTCIAPVPAEEYILAGRSDGVVAAVTHRGVLTSVAVDVNAVCSAVSAASGSGAAAAAGGAGDGGGAVRLVLPRPSHPQLAVVSTAPAGLAQVSLPRKELSRRFTVPGGAHAVYACLCPRDKWLVAAAGDGRILVWKTTQDPEDKKQRTVPCYGQLAPGPSAAPQWSGAPSGSACAGLHAAADPAHPSDENAFALAWAVPEAGRVLRAGLRPKDRHICPAPPAVLLQLPEGESITGGLLQAHRSAFPEQRDGSDPLVVPCTSTSRGPLLLAPVPGAQQWQSCPLVNFLPPPHRGSASAVFACVAPASFRRSLPGLIGMGGGGGATPFAAGRRRGPRRSGGPAVWAMCSDSSGLLSMHKFAPGCDCLCPAPAPPQPPPPASGSPGEAAVALGGSALIRVCGGAAHWQDLAAGGRPVRLPSPPGAAAACFLPPRGGSPGSGAVFVADCGGGVAAVTAAAGAAPPPGGGQPGGPEGPGEHGAAPALAAWRGPGSAALVLVARGSADGATHLRLLEHSPAPPPQPAAERGPPAAQPPPPGLGLHVVCSPQGCAVAEGPERSAPAAGHLPQATSVEVLEVVTLPGSSHVRGRIAAPIAGWISVVDTATDFRWAQAVGAPAAEPAAPSPEAPAAPGPAGPGSAAPAPPAAPAGGAADRLLRLPLRDAMQRYPDWAERLGAGLIEDEGGDDEVTEEWVAARWCPTDPGHEALRCYLDRIDEEEGVFRAVTAQAPSAAAPPPQLMSTPPRPPPLAAPPRPPPLAAPPRQGHADPAQPGGSPAAPQASGGSPATPPGPAGSPGQPAPPARATPLSGSPASPQPPARSPVKVPAPPPGAQTPQAGELRELASLVVPAAGGQRGAPRRARLLLPDPLEGDVTAPPPSGPARAELLFGAPPRRVPAVLPPPGTDAVVVLRVARGALRSAGAVVRGELLDALGAPALSAELRGDGAGKVGGAVQWRGGVLRPGADPVATATFDGLALAEQPDDDVIAVRVPPPGGRALAMSYRSLEGAKTPTLEEAALGLRHALDPQRSPPPPANNPFWGVGSAVAVRVELQGGCGAGRATCFQSSSADEDLLGLTVCDDLGDPDAGTDAFADARRGDPADPAAYLSAGGEGGSRALLLHCCCGAVREVSVTHGQQGPALAISAPLALAGVGEVSARAAAWAPRPGSAAGAAAVVAPAPEGAAAEWAVSLVRLPLAAQGPSAADFTLPVDIRDPWALCPYYAPRGSPGGGAAGLLLWGSCEVLHLRLCTDGRRAGRAPRHADDSDSAGEESDGAEDAEEPPGSPAWKAPGCTLNPFADLPPLRARPAQGKAPGMGMFGCAAFKSQDRDVGQLREQLKGPRRAQESFSDFEARIFTEEQRARMKEEAEQRRRALLSDEGGRKGRGAGGAAGAAEVKETLAETREALDERGRKVQDVALKTQEMSDEAGSFQKLCQEYARKQREKKWWQL